MSGASWINFPKTFKVSVPRGLPVAVRQAARLRHTTPVEWARLPVTRADASQHLNWPELMSARTAARYVDEPSVKAFLRRVGSVYPKGMCISGRRGNVWRKRDLDTRIAALRGPIGGFNDLADVL